MGDAVTALSGLIPEISFDLVGRVIPGAVIVLTWGLVHPPLADAYRWLLDESGWMLTAAVAIGGYVAAFVLMGLWNLAALRGRPSDEPDLATASYGLRYNAVRVLSPAAGARLVKLSAECNAGRVLCSGWLLAALYDLVRHLWTGATASLPADGLLVVGALGAWCFARHIDYTLRNDVRDHWYLLWQRRGSFRAPRGS